MDGNSQVVSNSADFSWRRLVAAEGILTGALMCAGLAVAYWGWTSGGERGLAAASVALLVSWIPNSVSLLIVSLIRDPFQSLSAVFLGMMLRLGPPLALGWLLLESRHWLIDAGVLPMVLVMYLISLFVETVLSLWILGAFRGHAVKVS